MSHSQVPTLMEFIAQYEREVTNTLIMRVLVCARAEKKQGAR